MRPSSEPGALRLGKPQPAVAIVEQHLAFGVPRSLPHVAGTREPYQGDCTQRSGSLESSRSTPFLRLPFTFRLDSRPHPSRPPPVPEVGAPGAPRLTLSPAP